MPSLKSQKDFQQLKDQGQFVHITHWLAVSFKKKNNNSLGWAWTASKKIGTAVVRNRLKRWGRDFVREFDEENFDINFIFKVKNKEFYKNLSRVEFNQAFEKAFSKIS